VNSRSHSLTTVVSDFKIIIIIIIIIIMNIVERDAPMPNNNYTNLHI
jgi:hypothetical protein